MGTNQGELEKEMFDTAVKVGKEQARRLYAETQRGQEANARRMEELARKAEASERMQQENRRLLEDTRRILQRSLNKAQVHGAAIRGIHTARARAPGRDI